MENKTRIMAIDYGDARTGIAVSDESASIIGDAWVISERRPNVLAKAIIDVVVSRGVGVVVVGYPKNMDGSVGFRALACEAFAENLRKLLSDDESVQKSGLGDIEVVLSDERLTTMMAGRLLSNVGKHGKKRKSTVDAVAAALILEDYLARIANS